MESLNKKADANQVFDIKKIVRKYNGETVLEVENLIIKRGFIYALIGPNGAGKSTLLRQLNLLEEPEVARFKFLESAYSELKANKLKFQRMMTLVFQKPLLFNTSVYENVAYGLKVRGLSQVIIKEKVEGALKMVGLLEKTKQMATTLSGGEAQKVALARAIVFKPEILLLDEPTSNLDPQNGLEVERLVKRINEEMGTTIIIVTHNMFQAKRLAQKVIFLMNGKIVETGEVNNIFTSPQAEKTKAFIQGEIVF